MAAFSWRRKQSQNFGEVWVPAATVEFQTARGTVEAMDFFVDSGAVVSLLRRSAAALLGIPLEAGRRIWLANVGGGRTEAFVHDLTIRLAAVEPPFVAPFAVATVKSVPQLLGRLGIFERCRIEFDPVARLTRIGSPET